MPGDLDLTFNGTGKVITPIGFDDGAQSIAIQSDGKIVVAGYDFSSSKYNFALVRYNTDGSLDMTFDGDGIVVTAIGASTDVAFAVAIQADGKIVVAGESYNGANYDFAVARYNADGTLDTTGFGTGTGKVTTPIGAGNDIAFSVAVQTDGKIVVAGYSRNGTDEDFALVRYNADGSLDTGFNGTGKVVTPTGAGNDHIYNIKIDSTGRIVAGGKIGVNADFALARYNSNGSLDTAFDGDGILTTAFGAGDEIVNSVALQADGKIVAAGYASFPGTALDFALARYNTDGTLDLTFGGGTGKVTTAVTSSDDSINGIGFEGAKILAGGFRFSVSGNHDFAVARYNADGTLDTSYGSGGTGVVSVDFGGNDQGTGLAIDSSGRAVIVGISSNRFAAARILGNLPTAATVTVSGRVMSGKNRGVSRAIVSMTDSTGNTRTAFTNHFGYFHFAEVEAGQTYIFSVFAKRYQFVPQVIVVNEEVTDLNFLAL